MREKEIICFHLLGTFSYVREGSANEEASLEEERGIGRKTLSFLQYLIVNHSRNISAEELIDTFWAESDSSNPANALRNMLFKIRRLLQEMFPEQKDALQTRQGYYMWNPRLRIVLDTEQFEEMCLKARQDPVKEREKLLRQAVSLYRGDLLSGNDSEWVKAPRQYYRTLYLDGCRTLLPLLEKQEQWMDIVSICSQAYQIDFCIEEFTAYQMRAFVAMGQPEQAIEKYEDFKKQLLREFEMPPTEQIEQIYTLALGLRKKDRGDDSEIFRMVCEENTEQQAFFCSFGVFQNIVALEKRHLARSGQMSTLAIISLGGDTAPGTDVRRLERILLEGLRTGDPVARLTAGSYIIMLTGADMENAQIAVNRIDSTFHRTYRRSNARLSFRLSALQI